MKNKKCEYGDYHFWKSWKTVATIFAILSLFVGLKVAFFAMIFYIIVVFRNGAKKNIFSSNRQSSDIKVYSSDGICSDTCSYDSSYDESLGDFISE